jgi:hypothetical protein
MARAWRSPTLRGSSVVAPKVSIGEPCLRGGDDDVACRGEFEPARCSKTLHHGNGEHGRRDESRHHVSRPVEEVEQRAGMCVEQPERLAYVGTRAECGTPRAHHECTRVCLGVVQCPVQRLHGGPVECVALLRSVEHHGDGRCLTPAEHSPTIPTDRYGG